MSTVLSPLPIQKFFDNNGQPLANGKLFTYKAATSAKLATYIDSTGGTPNTNPIILDYRGECRLWIDPTLAYQYVLAPSTDTDPPTNPFWSVDNITAFGTGVNFDSTAIDTGSVNAITVAIPSISSPVAFTRIVVKVANTNTGATTISINGGTAKAVTLHNIAALTGNELQANGIYIFIFDGAQWQLESPALQPPQIRTAAEIAAGVTPINYFYEPGDSRRQAITNDSSTDYTSAFQAVLSAAAGAVPVHVYKTQASGYIKLTGRVTAPANTHIVLHDGVELRWTATTATGSTILGAASRPGIEVTGNNFLLEGPGKLTGPTTGSVVTNEVAVMMKGSNTSTRLTGFHVRGDIEISSWGSYGTLCQFVDHATVEWNKIHDIGYCGAQFLSCTHWSAVFNEVNSITPGIAGDAYGISGSHDSTNYSSDSEVLAGRQRTAANPFCIDGHADFNTVYDVPSWRGVDFHGGFECTANFNHIYNTKYPIGLCSGSGSAAGYAGENNQVIGNTMTSKRVDGSATTVASLDGVAIVLNGGATVKHTSIVCFGNTIDGYGLNSAESFSISATNTRGAYIAGNRFTNWQRRAIYANEGDGHIVDNHFGAVANASNSRCIWIDGGTYGWNIKDNRHETYGGTAAAEGMRLTAGTPRCVIGDNDLEQATTPYVNAEGAQAQLRRLHGGLVGSRFTVPYSASMTIDVRNGTEFDITATNGTAFTINAPTNGFDGQTIEVSIINSSGGVLGAVTWNATFKMSAWTQPANGFSRSITFRYNGTNWVQKAQTGVDVPN